MPNRLIHETSPYLRQHAHNPVDWYPWGEEALAAARLQDKPLLLSIGYSACHWCHVMERESFEDDATAAVMNERFISVKVDREERPDLDQIYMTAVQGMTGHGGWPMTVFLTPEGKPFYGGTYFPPTDRGGMPGFQRVLVSVSEAYRERRTDIHQQADRVTAFVQQQSSAGGQGSELQSTTLDEAFESIAQGFDMQHGGFGGAPKFPQAMALDFLLRYYHRTGNAAALVMVETTLLRMAQGGIYDQIGGGFHRYSVDSHWLVPHFEKMLYDNALLARAYLHAYQATRSPLFRRIAEETLDYVAREMLDPGGGFYSTQDADSEGEEGKYYVWTPGEFDAVLGAEDGRVLRDFYGVSERGNFEGKTILTAPPEPETVAARHGIDPEDLAATVSAARHQLLALRAHRVPPARDDKILAAWNGLMLRTYAEAAATLGRPRDLEVAQRNAAFLTGELWRDGRLFRVHKDGQTKIPGYLEDYAAVADGLLALYETTFELRWFRAAREIADAMLSLFWDHEGALFYDTARDAEGLVARPRDFFDNATPSGTSLACHALLRLWALTGDARYEEVARAALAKETEFIRGHAVGLGHAAAALDFYLAPPQEVAIVGEPEAPNTLALLQVLRSGYLPNAVLALASPDDKAAQAQIPLLAGRSLVEGKATAYVCRGFVCDLPATDPGEVLDKLRSTSHSS